MQKATIKPGYRVRYRDAATLASNTLGILENGSSAVGTIVNGWMTIDHVIVNGVDVFLPVQAYMFIDLAWMTIVDFNPDMIGQMSFTDTITLNGITYTATYSVNDVVFKQTS